MNFQPAQQYWYTQNSAQHGPITGGELQQLVLSSRVAGTELVWCEGMNGWLPVAAVPGLMTAPGSRPALNYGAVAASPPTRWEVFPMAPLKGVRIGRFFAMAGATILLLIAAGGVFYFGEENHVRGFEIAAGVLAGAAGICGITTMVLGYIILYRGWAAIQGFPRARSTPGKAVGFMFIPFFNLYWVFIGVSAWAKDYNAFVRAREFRDAPPINEGLFVAYGVLFALRCIPLVNYVVIIPGQVLGFICLAQIASAVNYLKDESERLPQPDA